MSELKPCPFCGADCNEIYSVKRLLGKDEFYQMKCDLCRSLGSGKDTTTEAIDAWNTRPIEDKLRKELAKAEAKVKELEAEQKLQLEWLRKYLAIISEQKTKLEAAKQWQREALPWIKLRLELHVKLKTEVSTAVGVPYVGSEMPKLETLIKQAEEE